ncbi:YqaE/Pmp3 family membrane protein NDAI_0G05240 [Naumovozyma dairenensis CBS 421]|uniref:Uncharacterized protein n=1 Tax=Naumovozyma dairenensis (strain ATCC 10597 / BCRC 20456 / CBS 421 / NBRC 0211 / NRRL Y-12639) TaxID=1071378 RepID=J7RTF0_NAUDC|nr:hypothetical protein NDAI_0G05240 [Naumovozyma dairenensis CBS 421]CCK73507.1 hypothetical protein NDAI_0G05240 [Naumovozyma dairenensis CBS 421]
MENIYRGYRKSFLYIEYHHILKILLSVILPPLAIFLHKNVQIVDIAICISLNYCYSWVAAAIFAVYLTYNDIRKNATEDSHSLAIHGPNFSKEDIGEVLLAVLALIAPPISIIATNGLFTKEFVLAAILVRHLRPLAVILSFYHILQYRKIQIEDRMSLHIVVSKFDLPALSFLLCITLPFIPVAFRYGIMSKQFFISFGLFSLSSVLSMAHCIYTYLDLEPTQTDDSNIDEVENIFPIDNDDLLLVLAIAFLPVVPVIKRKGFKNLHSLINILLFIFCFETLHALHCLIVIYSTSKVRIIEEPRTRKEKEKSESGHTSSWQGFEDLPFSGILSL